MADEPLTLEGLPGDVLVDLITTCELSVLRQIISASPVALRLFKEHKVAILMEQLGNKYLQYGVPAPLIEALHYVCIHGLQNENEFWEEPVNRALGPTNAAAIRLLLGRKTVRWVESGARIVRDVESVASMLRVELRPNVPPSDNTALGYHLRGYNIARHLNVWMHELRCRVEGVTRAPTLQVFSLLSSNDGDDGNEDGGNANADDDSNEEVLTHFPATRKELFADPWAALAEEAAAANDQEVAARLVNAFILPTGRYELLGQVHWAETEEVDAFEDAMWRSGTAVVARLQHMSPQERQEFLLAKFNAYIRVF